MNERSTESGSAASYAIADGVALITLQSPPVNALSAALRQAISAGLDRAAADPQVAGIVITGAGKLFSGGADIKEFGKPPQEPSLPDLLAKVEQSAKPVVAAVNGAALGGGCELTLACHARVAGPNAKFGLPEVKLGLIPGAGGTQRLPRIMTPSAAFATMLTAKTLDLRAAQAIGLADDIAEDPVASARALVVKFAGEKSWPVTSERVVSFDADERTKLDAAFADARKKSGQLLNTEALIRAVGAAVSQPIEDGLAIEREEFLKLVQSGQSAALRHVFFAERAAAQIPGIGKEVKTRPVRRVAIIGAGTMGGGIAMSFANAGIAVTLIETTAELLDKGLKRIAANYAVSVKRGSMKQAAMDAALGSITGAVGLENVASADLVIEAAFENLDVKKEIFGKIGKLAASHAVLATNTSYLDVNEIARASGRPADVLGMHFFSPANIMRLLEVVRGADTTPDVLATGIDIGRRIGKLPVVSGVCFGFIGNRMLAQRSRAAERLLLAGLSPSDVDTAITEFGFRMGQFAMSDLAGIDIGWGTRKAFGGFAPVADRLAELGRFGQKTGRGFFLYPEGARTGEPDPELPAIIAEEAAKNGIAPEKLSRDEIVERLFFPLVNEAARILEEKIAYRASDVDLIWINGYGWPAWTGGPLFWADRVGLQKIVDALETQSSALKAPELKPAVLLRRLADEKRGFASLDA